MLEGTNLTIGAGTLTPFQTVTASWLQGEPLATRLNQRRLPGVRFEAIRVGREGRRQGGVRLVLADARQFRPASTALYILQAIHQLHPEALRFTPPPPGSRYRFDLVWGTDAIRTAIQAGESAERIMTSWNESLVRFLEIRQRYLIYRRGAAESAP
jgi:uncharacterized protein YbbC (DUF1343 family)